MLKQARSPAPQSRSHADRATRILLKLPRCPERMKSLFFVVAMATAVLLAAPGIEAQASEALAPGPGHGTLFAHADEEFNYWISTLQAEPNHAYDAPGYNQFGLVLGSEPGAFTWHIPLLPGVSESVPLDPSGTVEITLYLTTTAASAGQVSTSLTQGGTSILTGEDQTVTLDGDMTEITWSGAPGVDALAPGQDVSFDVRYQGPAAGVYMGMNGETWTQITLPIKGEAPDARPGVFYEDFAGPSFSTEHSHTEATSDTYIFNWTTDLESAEVSYELANHQNGSLAFAVFDGEDSMLIEVELDGEFDASELFESVAPGDWMIGIEYTDFVGDFSLAIEEKQATGTDGENDRNGTEDGDATDPAETGGPNGTTGEEGNATDDVDAADDETEDSPGVGLVALLGVVGAAAIAARRRR